ncbi:MAG: OsmC family protein [Pseudomonadales bacterium]
MHPFPHTYRASVSATTTSDGGALASPGVSDMMVGAPAEFGGTGRDWSPETLLVGAIGSCFILGFRAIATASKLEWSRVDCEVEGQLDRDEKGMRFTAVTLRAHLSVPDDRNAQRADRILHKAEESCLITNSLSASVDFQPVIDITG